MLSTTISTVLAAFACLFSLVALYLSYYAARWSKFRSERGPEMLKLSQIESELTDHADSLASIHDSLKKLRARIAMRQAREKAKDTGDSDLPDPRVDPAGWKKAKRLQLKKEGVL